MPTPTKVRFSLSTTHVSVNLFSQVLTLLIVNINDLGPTPYDTVFHAVGLDTLSYEPATSVIAAADWPTLGSMIDSGKQLVTFLDNGANTAVVPYLLDGTHVPPNFVIFFILMCSQSLQTFGRLPLMSRQLSIAV